MNKDEYRAHMRKYSYDTMVMSYVVTKHPDYLVMQEAGMEIVPYLLVDMLDLNWHCDLCRGLGYELVPTWEQEWYDDATFPPRSTGNNCPKCGGKGNINSWACMMLLTAAVGEDKPKVENWMRGRHGALTKLWQKWGEQRGYLPPTPDEPKPGRLRKIGKLIQGLLRLWGS